MKKIMKISSILLMAVMFVSIATSVFATPADAATKISDTTAFNDIGKKIIGGIQAVGSVAAIAVLAVLGVKYMLGSAEEKAEYKKTMLPYVIGAILVFAAANIASMVFTFAQSIA